MRLDQPPQEALPEKSVRTINFGAGVRRGSAARSANSGIMGCAPFLSIYHNGRAEPGLTSGGRAASSESKALFGRSLLKMYYASRLRNAASPAVEIWTHFGSGAASAL